MAARTWVLITALVLASAAIAGCTKPADDAPEQPDTMPPADKTPAPGNNAPNAPAPPPSDYVLDDAGEIQGPFEKTWEIHVTNVAYRETSLRFELASLQAGAPPTARVTLALYDPMGTPIKSAAVGLGADSNGLDWTFMLGELPVPGAYQLKATTGTDSPLPSLGAASYQLHAIVDY